MEATCGEGMKRTGIQKGREKRKKGVSQGGKKKRKEQTGLERTPARPRHPPREKI